ncbi:MAG: peptide deformylase [Deltaproteobacteria bacterium]|jgi:peptide deformylase|nr:peptide deformylase [Deltaproteobacteria bacterium]
MAILPILTFPNPILRQTAKKISLFDEKLRALAEDMRETMLAAPGAGLAAPQVGRSVRLIVIDNSEEDEEYGSKTLVLANPEFTHSEGGFLFEEGCLSVRDLNGEVRRYRRVEVKAQDLTGAYFTLRAEARRAVILQHEIDHLDGILFLDRLEPAERAEYMRRLGRILQKEDKK